MELYYAVSGSGAVLHTLNPRLHPDQVVWIADHAEDQVLFFDLTFLPLVEAIAARVQDDQAFVAMTDRAHMPGPTDAEPALLRGADRGEASDDSSGRVRREHRLVALLHLGHDRQSEGRALQPPLDRAAHLRRALPDALNCSARDTVLPVVPMFHVNAWGLPYAARMVGAKLVFPARKLDGKSLYELFEARASPSRPACRRCGRACSPTSKQNNLKFSHAQAHRDRRLGLPAGDDARFQERYGVEVLHAWGMTEMSPLGTLCTLKGSSASCRRAHRDQAKQGRAVFGVDMKIVDDDGNELPWDGKPSATCWCAGRGSRSYFKGEGGDPAGRRLVPDRRRRHHRRRRLHADHRPQQGRDQVGRRMDQLDRPREHRHGAPKVADGRGASACKHPKWDERPLLVVVKKPGAE
jgi:acyl-CoA synthetase (AMP-forming)/AMP-acid ligase II